jgi:hypothetical protein
MRAPTTDNRHARRRDFLEPFQRDLHCPVVIVKRFRFAFHPNQTYNFRIPHSQEGRFRDRHGRWERDAMDAISQQTSDDIADGEVVWSWRPKAGATLCGMTRSNGDNKAWSPGRARISRKTIAQGRPGDFG